MDKMETRVQLRKCAADIDASRILNDDEPTYGTRNGTREVFEWTRVKI